MVVFSFIAHRPHKSSTPRAIQREHRNKIGPVQRNMQFAVHRFSAGIHVSDIEDMRVSPTRKANTQRTAHRRACSIAARNVSSLACFLSTIRLLQAREHSTICIFEMQQFRVAFDVDTNLG